MPNKYRHFIPVWFPSARYFCRSGAGGINVIEEFQHPGWYMQDHSSGNDGIQKGLLVLADKFPHLF
jgi:hypothetical protein